MSVNKLLRTKQLEKGNKTAPSHTDLRPKSVNTAPTGSGVDAIMLRSQEMNRCVLETIGQSHYLDWSKVKIYQHPEKPHITCYVVPDEAKLGTTPPTDPAKMAPSLRELLYG